MRKNIKIQLQNDNGILLRPPIELHFSYLRVLDELNLAFTFWLMLKAINWKFWTIIIKHFFHRQGSRIRVTFGCIQERPQGGVALRSVRSTWPEQTGLPGYRRCGPQITNLQWGLYCIMKYIDFMHGWEAWARRGINYSPRRSLGTWTKISTFIVH